MEVDTSPRKQQIFAENGEKLNGDNERCRPVAGEEAGEAHPRPEVVPPEDASPRDDGSDPSNRNLSNGGGRRKRSRRKHKAGRHHNRKWKPYDKLTWEERKVLEERETRRANIRREELFAAGQPMAPYNTTQFLMEQHEGSYDGFQEKLVGEGGARPPRERAAGAEGCDAGSGSPDSSEDYCQSEEEDFNQDEKDFAEAYENFHAERLQSLTKDELIREYLELETKTENMETRLKDMGESPTSDKNPVFPSDSATDGRTDVPKLEAEIKELRKVNSSLKRENDLLRNGPKSA